MKCIRTVSWDGEDWVFLRLKLSRDPISFKPTNCRSQSGGYKSRNSRKSAKWAPERDQTRKLCCSNRIGMRLGSKTLLPSGTPTKQRPSSRKWTFLTNKSRNSPPKSDSWLVCNNSHINSRQLFVTVGQLSSLLRKSATSLPSINQWTRLCTGSRVQGEKI